MRMTMQLNKPEGVKGLKHAASITIYVKVCSTLESKSQNANCPESCPKQRDVSNGRS